MKDTILIVDDTPTNLQLLVKVLSDCGYRTLVAEDGAAALEQSAEELPDLILMDVMMPNMDGFEACRRFKQSVRTRDIPVIFMTARSEISDRLTGFEAGAVDYVIKPFQKEEVLARISTHLTLLKQKRALGDLAEQRSRFMRVAAHDLRNPLTVIAAWSELGVARAPNQQVAEIFEKIDRAGRQMKVIIEDFLALQMAQGDVGREKGVFDLRAVLQQAIEQQGFSASAKEIQIEQRLPERPLPALGNLAHTHQIFTNYLSNAIKFSPRCTTILISILPTLSAWRIEVQDQGPGVARDERSKLFVEFARISNKPTAGESSTRLGLAIVKNLAEAQGGRAGADFPDSGGSIFWLEIPMAVGN